MRWPFQKRTERRHPQAASSVQADVKHVRPAPPPQPLLERISRNGDINDPSTPRPLVTLEEFFEGNDDYGSIGYNFGRPQPAPAEFYALFQQIRDRPDVSDVLVEVSQHEMPDEWPSTDTVWIITSSVESDVLAWLGDRFAPDDQLWIGWTDHKTREPYAVPSGMRPIGVWWD
jgi:hypothetical protein